MNKSKPTAKTILKYKTVVDEWFLCDFKVVEAYKKVYPNVKDSTAMVNFSSIQKIPEIKEYIKEKREGIAKVVNVTHAGILRELQNFLELDVTETIGLTKEEIKMLPIEIRRTITSHKSRCKRFYDKDGKLLHTEEVIELRFISKERVLEMINKHIGFYEADNQQKVVQIDYDNLNVETLMNIWDARSER